MDNLIFKQFQDALIDRIRKEAKNSTTDIRGISPNIMPWAGKGSDLSLPSPGQDLSFTLPALPFQSQITTVGLWHCEDGSGATVTDDSDNTNTLAITGAAWSHTFKFTAHSLLFNGSTDKCTCTLTSEEPIKHYLFVAAWGNGTGGVIFDWPGVFTLTHDGTKLVATIMGETINGPAATTSAWQLYACQFVNGNVFIIVDDVCYILTSTAVILEPTAYAIEWGHGWTGNLDEMYIDANIMVEEDWPLYPQAGFPQDCCRWKFKENTGSTAYGVAPNFPLLTLTNCTWATGYKDYAIVFNGTTSYATATVTAQSLERFTIDMIVKFDSAAAMTLIDQTSGLNLAYDGTGFKAALNGVTNPTTQICTWTPVAGTWYRVSLSYDGAYKYIYINGDLRGKIAATGTANIAATLIVGKTVAGAVFFDGTIDYLAITATQVCPYVRPFHKFVLAQDGFDGLSEWVL